jgi:gas vesicle protein
MNKIVSVLLAAAGGFAAGVLLAPKSGKETRQDIKDRTTQYKGKAEDGFEEAKKGAKLVKDELSEGAESIKTIAEDASAGAGRTAQRVKEEVSKRAASIKGDVGVTAENVKKAIK